MTGYSRSETVPIQGTFSINGVNVDPSTISLKIYNAIGTLKETILKAALTRTSTGVYTYDYDVPSDGVYGIWRYEFIAVTTGGTAIHSGHFTIEEDEDSHYTTAADVYRTAGLTSNVISEDDVREHIIDNDAQIDEMYGRSFKNATSKTEWFDTFKYFETTTIRNTRKNKLFLKLRPVQSITSIATYDTTGALVKTLVEDIDFYLDAEIGLIQLIDSSFTNQRKRVKIIYTYGYETVPRNIKKLSSTMSAIGCLIQQIGGTYDDVTSYSLPTGVSVGVGEPYMNMTRAIAELQKLAKKQIEVIGALKTFVIAV